MNTSENSELRKFTYSNHVYFDAKGEPEELHDDAAELVELALDLASELSYADPKCGEGAVTAVCRVFEHLLHQATEMLQASSLGFRWKADREGMQRAADQLAAHRIRMGLVEGEQA